MGCATRKVGTESFACNEGRLTLPRIGSSPFIHLLSTSSIFQPLANNCYSQLCGRPMHALENLVELAKHAREKKRKAERQACRSGEGKKQRRLGRVTLEQASRPASVRDTIARPAAQAPRSATEIKIMRNMVFYQRQPSHSGRSGRVGLPKSRECEVVHVPAPFAHTSPVQTS